jgi:hypothetical protein
VECHLRNDGNRPGPRFTDEPGQARFIFAGLGVPGPRMERACGFDRSQLYSDEGSSIGAVAAVSARLIC